MEGIRCTLGLSCLYSTCIPNWHRKNQCCSAQQHSGCLDSSGTRAPQAPNLCCYPDTVLSALGSSVYCSYLCLTAIQDASVPLSACPGRVLRAHGAGALCGTLQEPQLSHSTQELAGCVVLRGFSAAGCHARLLELVKHHSLQHCDMASPSERSLKHSWASFPALLAPAMRLGKVLIFSVCYFSTTRREMTISNGCEDSVSLDHWFNSNKDLCRQFRYTIISSNSGVTHQESRYGFLSLCSQPSFLITSFTSKQVGKKKKKETTLLTVSVLTGEPRLLCLVLNVTFQLMCLKIKGKRWRKCLLPASSAAPRCILCLMRSFCDRAKLQISKSQSVSQNGNFTSTSCLLPLGFQPLTMEQW